jgi:hypothetical protein
LAFYGVSDFPTQSAAMMAYHIATAPYQKKGSFVGIALWWHPSPPFILPKEKKKKIIVSFSTQSVIHL